MNIFACAFGTREAFSPPFSGGKRAKSGYFLARFFDAMLCSTTVLRAFQEYVLGYYIPGKTALFVAHAARHLLTFLAVRNAQNTSIRE